MLSAARVLPVSWQPTWQPGLIFWGDASQPGNVTQAGGLASAWTDLGGSGRQLTAAGAARPAYSAVSGRNGGPGLTGDAANVVMQGAFALPQPIEVYVSAKFTGSGVTGTVFDGKTVNTARIYRNTTTSQWSIFSGQNGDLSGALTAKWNVFSAVYNAGSSFMWVNGSGLSQAPGTCFQYPADNTPAPKPLLAATPAGITLFAAGNGADKSACTIDEVIVYSSPRTTEQRAQIDSYFAARAQVTNALLWDGNSFNVTEVGALPRATSLALTSFGPTIVNNGVGGETTQVMLANAPTVTWPWLHQKRGAAVVVAVEVTNDVYYGATAAQAFADIQAYVAAAIAAGADLVVPCTFLSRSGGTTPANFNVTRATVNGNMVGLWGGGAVAKVRLADAASDPNIGVNGAESNLTYFQNDLTHLNLTGSSIFASYVTAAIQAGGYN